MVFLNTRLSDSQLRREVVPAFKKQPTDPASAHARQLKGSTETEEAHDFGSV